MSKTENVELTVLCLITDGDRMLLQNRRKCKLSTVYICKQGLTYAKRQSAERRKEDFEK